MGPMTRLEHMPAPKARNRRQRLRLRRARAAAAAYALADRSDPFAYRRALAHILCGVAAPGDYGKNARP